MTALDRKSAATAPTHSRLIFASSARTGLPSWRVAPGPWGAVSLHGELMHGALKDWQDNAITWY